MLSKSLARVLAESTEIKHEEQLTLNHELAHLLFCHYELEIQGSHLESAWDKLNRPNRLLLLMFTWEYLAPKTARVSKVRRNINFCITLGHYDDNLHESFASLVNNLYIEEARENFRYLESSSRTVRVWLESFILPKINEQILAADAGVFGLSANQLYWGELEQDLTYQKTRLEMIKQNLEMILKKKLDSPMSVLAMECCKVLRALKKPWNGFPRSQWGY